MVAEPAAMQRPSKIISLDGRRRLMEEATEEKAKREPAVAIPLVYTQMLKGDARAAMFLAQVLFHQRSEKAIDGWFWHTLDQWEDELGFSDDAESRCCKTLKGYGLQTKVKAVNHIPKKHYHVDEDALQEKVAEFRHFRESRKCEKAQQKPVSVATSNGYGSTSGKTVNDDTSGKAVNGTSVEPVNGTSGKAEDLQGKEDKDLKTQREEVIPDANASVGVTADFSDAPAPAAIKNPLSEDSAEYKLACYLYDAIQKLDVHHTLPPRTVKGLSTWIDPPKGSGLRQLLLEYGEKEREYIRQVINWLALPETSSYWQTRFLNRKNNPGRMLYDNYGQMKNASTPRQRGTTNGNHQTIQRAQAGAADSPAIVSEREREKQRERDIAATKAGKPPPSAA